MVAVRLCALWSRLKLVAHLGHHPEKVPLGDGGSNCLVDVRPEAPSEGRTAFLLCLPFSVAFRFPLRLFYYRQIVLPAKLIRINLHIPVILCRSVKLFPIHKRNRIQNEVGMKVVCFIQTGSHYNLIPLSPQPLRQLGNFMSYFWCRLARGKGLILVISCCSCKHYYTRVMGHLLYRCTYIVNSSPFSCNFADFPLSEIGQNWGLIMFSLVNQVFSFKRGLKSLV